MALSPDEMPTTNTDEVNSSSSTEENSIESKEEISSPIEFLPSNEINLDKKRQNRLKSRSVSFAPTVQEYEIPSRHSLSSSQLYLDALIESYKLQTSNYFYPKQEEKIYIPKTIRTRLNPQWREHRIRRLMNKLEELSLWDREEELKVTQAQSLREQKLEQIQDRHRNQELCLHLMRQRHESEMESAVLLDRTANHINDENTKALISRTMNLTSPADLLAYDLPTPPHILKRPAQQEQEKLVPLKTPVGRYRQFETKMNNKIDKINQKLQPDRQIMRTYTSYRGSIPPTVSPLFNETYSILSPVPDRYSSNKYNQYHSTASNYSNHSPQHASSPDYETRLRSHSNRDVRVPLKEEANEDDNSDDDDNYKNSRKNSKSSKREYSFIHSRQPIPNNIHYRSLNDNLNIITHSSLETSKKILQNLSDVSNGISSTKIRSSSVPLNKRVTFLDENDENQENHHYNKLSKIKYSK